MYIYQIMSNNFGYLDIILLGMIAGFIILRLRSILGRKTGHESKVYPSFAEKEFSIPKNEAKPTKDNLDILEGKDKKEFLRGAEIAYESILTSFAVGDLIELKSLLSVSDVLSVCCPASKETINLINKETLEHLPKGAVVTNVARGDIIDDEALIDALNRRKVYAVGLDVYKGEPNLNPGYLKHKSAFILPHLGSATKETRIAMANLAIDNLEEFLKTGNCKNKVN